MKKKLTIIFSLISTLSFCQDLKKHIQIYRHNSVCLIDEHNVELIPSGKYTSIWTAYDYAGKYFVVTDFNRKEGIFELGNKEIVPCIYDDIVFFRNHGFVKKENKWAVVSSDFKEVSDFIFDNYSYFNKDGQAIVKIKDRWTVIDSTGKTLSQLPYDEIFSSNEDDAYKKAGNNKKYGLIDKNYKIIIPFEYEDVGNSANNSNYIFPVKKGGKWGYINVNNKVIVPFKYDFVTPLYNGFGWIRDSNSNTIGLINAKGEILFDDGKYSDIEYSQESKLIYTIKNPANGKSIKGYLDSTTFKVIIGAEFESCDTFRNGVAVVSKDGLSAVIDSNGKVVLPYKYELIYRWGENLIVTLNRKTGMIDMKGNILIPLEYDNFSFGGYLATVTKNGLQGIFHYNGKQLILPKYNIIQAISDEVFHGIKGDSKFIINKNGIEKKIE